MPEYLWNNGPRLFTSPDVFPLSTDSVLLGNFARPRARDRILDLGTGTGVLPILLLSSRPAVTAAAVELDPSACRLAQKNFDCNQLTARCSLISGDIRAHRRLLAPGSFDITISNPPYFSPKDGFVSPELGNARSESSCTLSELCTAAAWATRWGGSFCLVHRPERLPALFACLQAAGFEPKRIRPVHHHINAPVNLFLIEARRGGKPGLSWEKDLYLYLENGQESAELKKIYHRD